MSCTWYIYVCTHVWSKDCPRDQELKKWKMTEFSAPTSRPLISATDSLMETWDYCEHSELSVAQIGCIEVLLPPRDHARCGGISNMFLRKPVNFSVLGYWTSFFEKWPKRSTDLSGSPLYFHILFILLCIFYPVRIMIPSPWCHPIRCQTFQTNISETSE